MDSITYLKVLSQTSPLLTLATFYPDVEHDIRRTLEIQKKGIISGHDYRHDIPTDGVNKAVHEAFPPGWTFLLTAFGHTKSHEYQDRSLRLRRNALELDYSLELAAEAC